MVIKQKFLTALILLTTISMVSAEISIDISGLKSEDYNFGENLNFNVILLDNSNKIAGDVEVTISDALGKKKATKTVKANEGVYIKIENDFPSGIWNIVAVYGEEKVERTFTIGENSAVEFLIEGDELVIKNLGNVRYTRTIQIKIGDSVNSYAQNIGVGEEKRLKLVSPKGIYNIEVTDGEVTLKKESVQLFGTGNVVGAVDPELVGYTGLAGTSEPQTAGDRSVFLDKLPLTLVFVGVIGVLAILVAVERKVSKKSKGKK